MTAQSALFHIHKLTRLASVAAMDSREREKGQKHGRVTWLSDPTHLTQWHAHIHVSVSDRAVRDFLHRLNITVLPNYSRHRIEASSRHVTSRGWFKSRLLYSSTFIHFNIRIYIYSDNDINPKRKHTRTCTHAHTHARVHTLFITTNLYSTRETVYREMDGLTEEQIFMKIQKQIILRLSERIIVQ